MPTPAFTESLKAFTDAINYSFEHLKFGDHGTESYFKPVTLEFGSKRVRVVQHTNTASVYCFVDMTTGDIFKAAGYNSPAKGSRGNIFQPETYKTYDLSSTGWMYRR